MENILAIGSPKFPLHKFRESGANVILVIKKENHAMSDLSFKTVIIVDDYCKSTIQPLVGELIRKYSIKGIVTFTEENQSDINEICRDYSLPSISQHAIEYANNKHKMRQLLDTIDCRQVPYVLVSSSDSLVNFSSREGFPIIVKPISGTGSVNVHILYNIEQIEDFCRIYENEYGSLIAEKYIDGEEVSVECFTNNGTHTLLSITDKFTTGAPHFVEFCHVSPGKNMKNRDRIEKVVFALLNALELNFGISHTEIKINDNGIYIIETHVRPGGDCIMDLLEKSYGFDPYILLANKQMNNNEYVEKQLELIRHQKNIYVTGIRYIIAPLGKIKSVEGFKEIENMPGWYRSFNSYKVGDQVGAFYNSFTRNGWVMAYGNSTEEVINRLEAMVKHIKITVYD